MAERPPVVVYRPDELPEDGRVARSYRTIEKIIQAMLELVERENEKLPTADQVASRAGVSRRAVYLHFESLEVLFVRAFQRRIGEVVADLQPPAPDSPLEARIDWFAESWTELLERLLPYGRAYQQYRPASPEVSTIFENIRAWMRAVAEGVFKNELASCSEEERTLLVTALHYLTSCAAWANVRDQGTDASQAGQALHRLLCTLWRR